MNFTEDNQNYECFEIILEQFVDESDKKWSWWPKGLIFVTKRNLICFWGFHSQTLVCDTQPCWNIWSKFLEALAPLSLSKFLGTPLLTVVLLRDTHLARKDYVIPQRKISWSNNRQMNGQDKINWFCNNRITSTHAVNFTRFHQFRLFFWSFWLTSLFFSFEISISFDLFDLF